MGEQDWGGWLRELRLCAERRSAAYMAHNLAT